jgi:hypothetical protein
MKKGFQFYIKLYYKMTAELSDECIKTYVLSVFPSSEYNLHFCHPYGYSCDITTKDNRQCLYFIIYNNDIEISKLAKCGKSGTDSLSKVEQLAKKIPNINYIQLYDGSTIEKCGVEISLIYIKILTTGKSWYNSQGYFSRNYEAEFENNKIKINMKLTDFLDEVYATNLKVFTEREREKCKSKEDCELVIGEKNQGVILEQQLHKDKGLELFPYDETITVIEYFGRIWKEINAYKLCDDKTKHEEWDATIVEKCKWLSKTIEFIYNSQILQYEPYLRKPIDREKNGGKNKRKTSKNKNSKQKQTGFTTRSNKRKHQHKKRFY